MKNQTKEKHYTGSIKDCIDGSARCLVKPSDRVRITKTHRAGINQYAACEGDTFVITKVVDDQIPYGRWLQPSGVLAASELKLDPNYCTLITPEECGAPAGSEKYQEPTTLRSVTIDVSNPEAAHKAVDDALAEYQEAQKIHWRDAEVEDAKRRAMEIMAILCEQGISMVWKIWSRPENPCIVLDCNYGALETRAMTHGYPANYTRTTFAKNADFNIWVGKCACLYKLIDKPIPDAIMRGIEADA